MSTWMDMDDSWRESVHVLECHKWHKFKKEVCGNDEDM